MAKKAKKLLPKEKPKSELDNLTFTDGKINKDEDIEKLKNLEEILGVKKMNPFGTTNMDVFLERLNEMTNIDLQHMCERVGIFASGSRMQIKEKLIREFKSFNKGSLSMTVQAPAFQLDPTNPAHKEALKNLRLP